MSDQSWVNWQLLSWVMSMILIRDIVKETLTSGYLSSSAEEQLRQLLANKYDKQDFNAFMALQLAVVKGLVKQESRG